MSWSSGRFGKTTDRLLFNLSVAAVSAERCALDQRRKSCIRSGANRTDLGSSRHRAQLLAKRSFTERKWKRSHRNLVSSGMKICFIQTGGTIDKDYPKTTKGYAFEFGEPAVKRIVQTLHHDLECEFVTACKADSLDINREERNAILSHVLETTCAKIVITHGTDTMIETGQFLADALREGSSGQDKTVVLTGAHRPEKFRDSDASFNVGCAVGALSICRPGVYLAMSGKVMPIDEVRRSDDGVFMRKAAV